MQKTGLWLTGVLLAVLLTYSNHFENSFHFDDSHTVVDNPYIRDLRNLPRFFTDASTFSVLPANRSYRPLVTLSLALDYWMGHGLNPKAFHVSTFAWFTVQLALMYVLFIKLCDAARPDPRNQWVALFAVAVYGLHPAIAETVNYVIQRGDIYSTLDVIAALVLYAASGKRSVGPYLILVMTAILSKPPAMVFPALLFVYILLFENESPWVALRRCVPSLVVVGVSAWLVTAMTPATFTPGSGSASAYRMTQPLVALRYFGSFVLPTRLSADSDMSAVTGLMDQGAWLGFVFVIVVIGAAAWCSMRKDWHPVAFGLWWYIIALIPTSIFPLAEVENDHRMFFPFVGLVLAFCWLPALWLYRRPLMSRGMVVVVASLCACVLTLEALGTRQRNEVWHSEESLWYDVTLKSPKNARGLMNYGLTQMEKGASQVAFDYFERAAVYTPAYYVLEINRGIVNGTLNHDDVAEQHFQRSIELAPSQGDTHYFYARWLHEKKRWSEAIAHLQTGISLNPDYLDPRHLLMEIWAQESDWPEVKAAAQATLDRFPSDEIAAGYLKRAGSVVMTPEAYLNLSLSFHQAGKYRESIAASEEALKLRPDYAEAYNNIAAAHENLKEWDAAIAAAQRALKIKPDYQLARNNLLYSQQEKAKAPK